MIVVYHECFQYYDILVMMVRTASTSNVSNRNYKKEIQYYSFFYYDVNLNIILKRTRIIVAQLKFQDIFLQTRQNYVILPNDRTITKKVKIHNF